MRRKIRVKGKAETARKPCCPACEALLEECGPELWPMYSKRLLWKGWAGQKSEAEAAYVKAHLAVSEALAAARAANGKKLAQYRADHRAQARPVKAPPSLVSCV